MNAVASRLSPEFHGIIVTPAPSVALAALARGAHVHLIGGPLCPEGAMAIGGDAERFIGTIAADLCLLGVCGLWADFGLSAEDAGEVGVKPAMAHASARAYVAASAAKLMRRGRYRVLDLDEVDGIVTDAVAERMAQFVDAGIEVNHV